jgi:hypothetical protein
MLPSNWIKGTKIAFGRATWIYDEDSEKGAYNFSQEDSFHWTLNPGQLKEMGIDEQDLLDCVEQAEEQLGAPDEYRPALGLMPHSGLLNIGAKYRSRTNPNVLCVFTPTSMQFPTTSTLAPDHDPIDGYFEWYYSEPELDINTSNIADFMKEYERLAGTRNSNTVGETMLQVPSYEEASLRSANLMEDSRRERFLESVWWYHKASIPFSRKQELRESILETWKSLNRVQAALSPYGE